MRRGLKSKDTGQGKFHVHTTMPTKVDNKSQKQTGIIQVLFGKGNGSESYSPPLRPSLCKNNRGEKLYRERVLRGMLQNSKEIIGQLWGLEVMMTRPCNLADKRTE